MKFGNEGQRIQFDTQQWEIDFQREHGREPSLNEYKQALGAQVINQGTHTIHQMPTAGLQFANELPAFMRNKVVPSASRALKSASVLVKDVVGDPSGLI